jgi:bromodomain adjacent to zinc finger domain protein 1A
VTDLYLTRFYAKVVQVYPPNAADESVGAENQASSSSAPPPPNGTSAGDTVQIHKIGGDLKIPAKEALVRDDPLKYFYKVQILEEQHEKSHEKGKAAAKDKAKWIGALMDVQCSTMRSVTVSNLTETS